MKKAIFYPLIVIYIFCMTSCSSQSEKNINSQTQESVSTIAETTAVSAKVKAIDVEEIVKNDLEIDGIHISLPCTNDELLAALGVKYSFDSVGRLFYDDELTQLWIVPQYGTDQVRTIGVRYNHNSGIEYSDTEKGILTIKSIDGNQPYSFEQITDAYNHLPNIVIKFGDNEENTRIQYYNGNEIDTAKYVIQCSFTDLENCILVSYYEYSETKDE